MNASKYLNGILTVNAILLGGLLWTQVANTPLLAEEASAQARSGGKPPAGFTNAGTQRQEMVRALKEVEAAVKKNSKLLESGRLKVQVTNLDEVRIDARR
ncbi:MAG: hypothetical protein ACYTGR_05820 [Planctomycetota bacterium]|jgi:hypothetical protein